MSDDELFKAVLSSGKGHSMENNKNTSPKKRRMAPIIAAVAAAAALATTAGAVTNYYRNVNEDYNNILAQADIGGFSQAYTDKDGNVLDQKDKAEASGMYEKLNIELNKSFECDGFTLEVPGAISDGEELLIMYDLIFDEDPWSGEHPWFIENEELFINGVSDCDAVKWWGRLSLGAVSERDGKTVYSSFIPLYGLKNCTNDTLKITFDYLWGNHSINENDRHFFDAELEIPISDDLAKFNKTIDVPDTPYVKLARWGNWDLTQIEVSPLGVTFNMKTDGETPDPIVCKDYRPEIPVYVNFKDGTTLDLMQRYSSQGIDPENKTMRIEMHFNYPVDVDEIQSIQFASALVDMNGGVTELDIPEIPMEEEWNPDLSGQK